MRQRHRRSDCPVHFALEVFGDPWTLLVVRDLMFKGRTTYSDFLGAEEGIATNILADRLARLEQDEIVEKHRDPMSGRTRRYRLTAKGIALLPILLDIIDWSARYDARTAADRAFVRRLRHDRAGLEGEVRATLQAAAKAISPGDGARRMSRPQRLSK